MTIKGSLWSREIINWPDKDSLTCIRMHVNFVFLNYVELPKDSILIE